MTLGVCRAVRRTEGHALAITIHSTSREEPPVNADLNPPTDTALVSQIQAGDRQAGGELYDRYATRLFGLVRRQLGIRLANRIEPEDIVQSVFKSMLRGINAGRYFAPDAGSLWHLLATITVHKIRRKASRQVAACRDSRREVAISAYSEDTLVGGTTLEEFEQTMRECLESLDDSLREIVLLRVQGFSVEEISNLTERSRRTIERQLQRAREKLSTLLNESH